MTPAVTDNYSGFRLRRDRLTLLFRVLALSGVACLASEAGAQELPPRPSPVIEALSQGPVSPDSADKLRVALERPPAQAPTDAVDVIEFPFKVILFPLRLVGYGLSALLDVATQPPSTGGLGATYRNVVAWGVTPALGGLGERSGLGGAVRLDRFNPLFVEAGWTLRGWQLYRGGFVGRWGSTSVELSGGWYRQNSLLFWGFGPNSPPDDDSEYRWDNGFVTFTGRVGFGRNVQLAVGGGFDRNTVTFREGPLVGVPVFGTEVTRFAQVNANLVWDLTRMEKFQQRGFRASIGGAGYLGFESTSSEFWRGAAGAEGYVPFNDRQYLALRGLVDIMRGNEAGEIPFMYLSSIGGTSVLRSYNTNRFRDRDRLALTAEWRYEIWRDLHERSRVEAFVFWDEATVARKLTEIDEFRTSAGLGMRFIFGYRVRAVTFLAFGAEGARFTFSFSAVEF